MAWRKKNSWAYYGRNDSYSKSYNAEWAERNGRFPKTRAAKELGLNTKVFDEARWAINYRSKEWHHVGKYANPVNYYDTEELKNNPEFWKAASLVVKSKKKRIELFSKAIELEEKELIPLMRRLNFAT